MLNISNLILFFIIIACAGWIIDTFSLYLASKFADDNKREKSKFFFNISNFGEFIGKKGFDCAAFLLIIKIAITILK